jgi:hypothetical protein
MEVSRANRPSGLRRWVLNTSPVSQLTIAVGVAAIVASVWLDVLSEDLLGVVLAALLGWAYLCVRAIGREERAKNAAQENHRLAVQRLVDACEWATHNILHAPQDDEGTRREAFEDWQRRVLQALAEQHIPEADISYFRVLRTYNARGLGGRTTGFEQIREECAEKTARLDEIVRRFETGEPRLLADADSPFHVWVHFTLIHLLDVDLRIRVRIVNRSKTQRVRLHFFLMQSDEWLEYWHYEVEKTTEPAPPLVIEPQSEDELILFFRREKQGRSAHEIPATNVEKLVLRLVDRLSEKSVDRRPDGSFEWR